MANINQVYLLGNLTKDPELKYTYEGMAIAEMGIAISKKWKDNDGTENRMTDFFNITAWNHLAENCAGTLKKGDRVFVGGHLNLRTWENRDGKKFNIVNITADVVSSSLEFSGAKDDNSKQKKIVETIKNNEGGKKGNDLKKNTEKDTPEIKSIDPDDELSDEGDSS